MKKLKECRNDYLAEIEMILETAKNEDRILTAEEIARLEELKGLAEDMNKQIATVEESRALTIVEENKEDKKEIVETMEKRELEIRQAEMENFVGALKGEDRALTAGANGIMIPQTVAEMIVTAIREKSTVLNRATVHNTIGQLRIVTSQEIIADYVTEDTDLTEGNIPLAVVTLNDFTMGSLIVVSKSLMAQTPVDVVNYVVDAVAKALANKIEKEVLVGTTGKIEGMATCTNIVETAGVLTIVDMIKAQARVKGQRVEDCIWVMSRSKFEMMSSMLDSNGRPFISQGYDSTGAFVNKMLGANIEVTDALEGAEFELMYGNFAGLHVKFGQNTEVAVLNERFATKNAIGVVGFVSCDAKVVEQEMLCKVKVATARTLKK